MRVVGVIPARYASERFPGKPLALIAGRPMLSYVVESALSCQKLSEVIVATDDDRISQLAKSLGVRSVMTDPDLPSGSDRVWAAIKQIQNNADVVINIQGDEPLLDPLSLTALVEPFSDDAVQMSTLAHTCEPEDLENPNTAKLIVDHLGNAIYFSRLPIPYSRHKASNGEILTDVVRHIGLYAYRPSFLKAYCEHGPCGIERAEGLEQLRALYMGAKIRVVNFDVISCGVDIPSDITRVEIK